MKESGTRIYAEEFKKLDEWLARPFKSRLTELLRARIVDLVLLEQREIGRYIDIPTEK